MTARTTALEGFGYRPGFSHGGFPWVIAALRQPAPSVLNPAGRPPWTRQAAMRYGKTLTALLTGEVHPMRSCCKQVREFIDFAKQLHAETRKLYDTLYEHAELTRVKMLLDFLRRHEQHMEETLARFENETRRGTLEAWLEYSPSLDVDAVIQSRSWPGQPSTDEILAAALSFDDALVQLYREVAPKANDQRTQAVLRDLLHLEEQEKIKVARAAMSLQEM